MDDVHKNLAQKHRKSEALIKAIVKDKTTRIEEEMSTDEVRASKLPP